LSPVRWKRDKKPGDDSRVSPAKRLVKYNPSENSKRPDAEGVSGLLPETRDILAFPRDLSKGDFKRLKRWYVLLILLSINERALKFRAGDLLPEVEQPVSVDDDDEFVALFDDMGASRIVEVIA
jgi:hypothetical protein